MEAINTQTKNIKKPQEPISYIETLGGILLLVFVSSIFSFLPTPLLIILSMVLIFLLCARYFRPLKKELRQAY